MRNNKNKLDCSMTKEAKRDTILSKRKPYSPTRRIQHWRWSGQNSRKKMSVKNYIIRSKNNRFHFRWSLKAKIDSLNSSNKSLKGRMMTILRNSRVRLLTLRKWLQEWDHSYSAWGTKISKNYRTSKDNMNKIVRSI